MDAHRSQSTARSFLAMSAPLGRFQQQRIRKRHRRLNMQDGTERARADALAKFRHLGMETPVIAQAESDSGFSSRIDRAFGIALSEGKRLFAKNMLSGFCGSDHLLRVQ